MWMDSESEQRNPSVGKKRNRVRPVSSDSETVSSDSEASSEQEGWDEQYDAAISDDSRSKRQKTANCASSASQRAADRL